MLNRALVDLGYCTAEAVNTLEWRKVYAFNSFAEVKRWSLDRLHTLLELCRKKSTPGDAHKNSVLKAIDEDIAGVTIEALAQREGVSKSYISRAFPDWTSETFMEYLTNKRIERAKELLESTSMKIDRISALVGYTDANYFCRVFKRLVGVSPSQYRGYKT